MSYLSKDLPGGSVVKNLPTEQETRIRSLSWKDSLKKEMATHSIFLPGKSHGQRSLEMLFLLLYLSANSTAGTKGRYYLAVISRLQRQMGGKKHWLEAPNNCTHLAVEWSASFAFSRLNFLIKLAPTNIQITLHFPSRCQKRDGPQSQWEKWGSRSGMKYTLWRPSWEQLVYIHEFYPKGKRNHSGSKDMHTRYESEKTQRKDLVWF